MGKRGSTDIDVNMSKPSDPRTRELVRRIEELEAHDEGAFGHFTVWDWLICIASAVVLPILLVLRFAP